MTPLQLRLAVLADPKVLLPTVAIATLGYLAIQSFGQNQLASFHLPPPYLASMESTLREIFAERYAQIALGWVASTLGLAWHFAGKQAKKASDHQTILTDVTTPLGKASSLVHPTTQNEKDRHHDHRQPHH